MPRDTTTKGYSLGVLVQVSPEVRLFLYHRYPDIDLDQVLMLSVLTLGIDRREALLLSV